MNDPKCTHTQSRVIETHGYSHPVSQYPYTDENPAAHGNIVDTDECSACGARRDVARNGHHEEFGTWGPSIAQQEAEAKAEQRRERASQEASGASMAKAVGLAVEAVYESGMVRVSGMEVPFGALWALRTSPEAQGWGAIYQHLVGEAQKMEGGGTLLANRAYCDASQARHVHQRLSERYRITSDAQLAMSRGAYVEETDDPAIVCVVHMRSVHGPERRVRVPITDLVAAAEQVDDGDGLVPFYRDLVRLALGKSRRPEGWKQRWQAEQDELCAHETPAEQGETA